MFGMGMPEILLILAIALIVIGPKKLPEIAKSLGRAMNEFKRATSDFKDSMEIDMDVKSVKKTFDDIEKEIRKKPIDVIKSTAEKTLLSDSESDSDTGSDAVLKNDRKTAVNEAEPALEGSSDTSSAPLRAEDADDSPATDIPAELLTEKESDPPTDPEVPETGKPV